MRKAAFRNLLIGYNLIQGLILTAFVGLTVIVSGNAIDTWRVLLVASIAIGQAILMTVVNVGAFRREDWSARVAIAHAILCMLVIFAGQVMLETKAPTKKSAGSSGIGEIFPFLIQGLVIVLAVKALRASDDSIGSVENPTEHATNLLALAASADGVQSDERIEMAMQYALQAYGSRNMPGLKQRVALISASPTPDQVLSKSARVLAQAYSPEQKQWLLDAAQTICSLQGGPDELAQTFLQDLKSQLFPTAGVHEPFGHASPKPQVAAPITYAVAPPSTASATQPAASARQFAKPVAAANRPVSAEKKPIIPPRPRKPLQ